LCFPMSTVEISEARRPSTLPRASNSRHTWAKVADGCVEHSSTRDGRGLGRGSARPSGSISQRILQCPHLDEHGSGALAHAASSRRRGASRSESYPSERRLRRHVPPLAFVHTGARLVVPSSSSTSSAACQLSSGGSRSGREADAGRGRSERTSSKATRCLRGTLMAD